MDRFGQLEPDERRAVQEVGGTTLSDIEMNMANWEGYLSSNGETFGGLSGGLSYGLILKIVTDGLMLEEHVYQHNTPFTSAVSNRIQANSYIDHGNALQNIYGLYPVEPRIYAEHAQHLSQPSARRDESLELLDFNSILGNANSSHLLTPLNRNLSRPPAVESVFNQMARDPQSAHWTNSPTITGAAYSHSSDDTHKSDICNFFRNWRKSYQVMGTRQYPIGNKASYLRELQRPSQITSTDLKDDICDLQGINWQDLGAIREQAHILRRNSYPRHVFSNQDSMLGLHYRSMPEYMNYSRALIDTDTSFRFRQLNRRYKTPCIYGHDQLRNTIAIPSKNSVIFAGKSGVHCFNPTFNTGKRVMNFTKSSPKRSTSLLKTITTLTAGDGLVIAGGMEGEYSMKSLASEGDEIFTSGLITDSRYGITNHIHILSNRRSGAPQAVFCSNDDKVRILDCQTNTFVQEHHFLFPMNCSATSPDGRLRLLIGDHGYPWIVDAESGKQLLQLGTHQEHGFACDWSTNGVHLATGHENGLIQIWDARNWNDPLQIIDSECGGARSMHFSPIGGGRPVLLTAKGADIVNIVDAVTFETQQKFDFFGEIGGTGFVPDGGAFFVAITDEIFGGFMEFERMSSGEEFVGSSWQRKEVGTSLMDRQHRRHSSQNSTDELNSSDDGSEISMGLIVNSGKAERHDELDKEIRTLHENSRRRRMNLDYEDMIF